MPAIETSRMIQVVAEPAEVTPLVRTRWANTTLRVNVDALEEAPPTRMVDVHYSDAQELSDPRLVMLRQPSSARARGYRLLRHRLLAGGDPRVIAVTSARSGEGKSTGALNLALAMAEDTMTSVVVVEANLRRPALAQMFGFEPPKSFVYDMTRLSDVNPPYPVIALRGVRAHLAALPRAPDLDGRIERTLFSAAILDLRSVYDYVVIDAASVLESGDADVAGECADGVLVLARAGTSKKSDLRRALDQLRPATVLGTVLVDT